MPSMTLLTKYFPHFQKLVKWKNKVLPYLYTFPATNYYNHGLTDDDIKPKVYGFYTMVALIFQQQRSSPSGSLI